MSSEHWRTQLNNYLQASYGTNVLSWEMISTGPRHDPTWLAIAYIRQVEHGRGTGRNQGSAKEQAAEEAYRTLIGQRGG